MKEFKINMRNQWNNAKAITTYFNISLIMFIALYYYYGDLNVSLTVCLSVFLFHLIPQLVLHLKYYYLNKNDILLYNSTNNEFKFIHNGKDKVFNLSNVKSYEYCVSYNMANNNGMWVTWDNYYHYIILLDDGTKIILSSLLLGGVLDFPPVNDKELVIKKSIFRWVNGPSIQISTSRPRL